jgi:hypothetical protein
MLEIFQKKTVRECVWEDGENAYNVPELCLRFVELFFQEFNLSKKMSGTVGGSRKWVDFFVQVCDIFSQILPIINLSTFNVSVHRGHKTGRTSCPRLYID